MEVASTSPKILRFGLYEVDLAAMQLRKSGIKIKLQEQPFQVLTMLLGRPGEIVTREELQKRLWPQDTFVVFDVGLNSAVKKLRQALGDDSENPRFIETLYRRGYRFLAPVEGGPPAHLEQGGNGQTGGVPGLAASDSSPLPSGIPREGVAGNKRKLLSLFVFAASITLAAYLGFRLRPPQPPQITGYLQITHDGLQKNKMVTDGERLFIRVHGEGGLFTLEQVSALGGESAPLAMPFDNVGLAGMAIDSSALFVDNIKLMGVAATWAVPLPTGAPRRVGQFAALSVAPTPDGSQLLMSSGSELYVTDSSGLNPHKLLTEDGGFIEELYISPDGRRLRFTLVQSANGSTAIWEANRDGSGVHPVFPGLGAADRDCCGKWTPDGKYFLFERFRDGHSNIWVLPDHWGWLPERPKAVQLTNGPLDFSYPVPSKDGKKLFAFGVQPRSELMRYEPKSGGFIPFLGGVSVSDVDFSIDGNWITYVSIPERALWRSKLDGSNRLQLTNPGTLWAGLPRWSPDGKQIVFMGKTKDRNWRAYLISSAGGVPQDLVPGAEVGMDPTWSPDGKSIALSLGSLSEVAVSRGITILNLETKQQRDLPGAENLFSPRWSPDGKFIAGITTDSEKLMVFEMATGKWTEVARMPIGYPSWSHDSKYLYFDTSPTRGPGFYRARISDHQLEEIADLTGLRRYWGEFGEWSGLAPDETPLLTRNASSEEVYALDWNHP